MANKFIVVIGTLPHGFEFHGPFNNLSYAEGFAGAYTLDIEHEVCWVIELDDPGKDLENDPPVEDE